MLATADSKNQAVSKLESLIERGRSRAANVIDHVMRHQPTDRLVRGDALEFRAADNLPEILVTLPDREQDKVDQALHRNAIYQMAHTIIPRLSIRTAAYDGSGIAVTTRWHFRPIRTPIVCRLKENTP
jgi:ABC-type uncharacterized transport system ATPase subunit